MSDDWYELRSGWPARIRWREDPLEVVFVEDKQRNVGIKPDKLALLRLLERLGLTVRINCNNDVDTMLTLDEYLQGGMSRFKPLSAQNVLNYRHEIKVMKEEMDRLPQDDPRRDVLAEKITRREQMLPPEKRVLAELGREQNQAEFWSPQARETRAKKKREETARAKEEKDVG